MKVYLTLMLLCGAALTAVVSATLVYHHNQTVTAAPEANQVFEVKGQVRGLEADGQTIRIAHEDIPGFMPAMEMPFTVKDATLLRGLAAGDTVKFQLIVTKDDSWITRIEKLPATATVSLPEKGAASTAAPEANAANPVEAGQMVPDFELIDQDGHPFRLSEMRGKAVVLTFIYTRCPLPNFCPLMSKNFSSLEERFAKEFPGKVQLLSISFDSEFDKPAVLKAYAGAFRKDEKDWTFATGTPEQVDRVTSLFGLIREPANGFINHDLRTALIGPDGRLVHLWRSNVWTPYEVQRMVREALQTQLASSRAGRR